MTVCIAAVCEDGNKIVIAADRMLTYPPPTSVEFETVEEKIEALSPSCIALVSGNTGYGTEILNNSRNQLSGASAPEIERVLSIVKNQYVSVRLSKIDDTIVAASLGSDYLRFLGKGGTLPAYLQPQPQVYQQLVMLSQQFNLVVDIIIAGIDISGAHISVITHPGNLISLDKLGYGAIGSGGIHATIYLSLKGQTRRKKFLETLYAVYVAKKSSEAAPGVGQVTDMAVLQAGKISPCGQPVLKELQKLFDESKKGPTLSYEELGRIYNGK